MKKLMELIFKGSTPRWLTIAISVVVAVCAIVFVIFEGGFTEQKIPGPNNSEYLVNFELNDGILELIEDCKLQKVGDTCEVKVGVKVMMLVAPTVKEEVKEVEAEKKEQKHITVTPIKPSTKPIETKINPELVKEVKVEETKEVEAE